MGRVLFMVFRLGFFGCVLLSLFANVISAGIRSELWIQSSNDPLLFRYQSPSGVGVLKIVQIAPSTRFQLSLPSTPPREAAVPWLGPVF